MYLSKARIGVREREWEIVRVKVGKRAKTAVKAELGVEIWERDQEGARVFLLAVRVPGRPLQAHCLRSLLKDFGKDCDKGKSRV